MRTTTTTLLAAQQAPSRVPYVQVIAGNNLTGVSRGKWERLYTGTEEHFRHGAAVAGDGSLLRVRINPVNSFTLYRQRVENPGPNADFSVWVTTGQSQCQVVNVAVINSEVGLFWVTLSGEVKHMISQDYGATWSGPSLLDYVPLSSGYCIAAAYRPDGDLSLFFTSGAELFVKHRVAGVWQPKVSWDKTTGKLSSVSAVYDDDWLLMVSGEDANENPVIWSLVYGDGGEVPSGVWSELKVFASAPAGSGCIYGAVSLDKPDVYRAFFVENLGGANPVSRVHWSHTISGIGFLENLWREPAPFDFFGDYGLALTHRGDSAWLSSPDGVWSADFMTQTLDLTDEVIGAQCEIGIRNGKLTVELNNTAGKFTYPGSGSLALLDTGCDLSFNPGYRTAAGDEVSGGLVFRLDAYEHISGGGKSRLALYALDGWQMLVDWRPRYQFRWNAVNGDTAVKHLLAFVLARAGLKLEVISESPLINEYYPDFTIHRGDNGFSIITRLLSFVPDVLIIEGMTAYLLYPLPDDAVEYVYGPDHKILQGKYQTRGWEVNRVQVTGFDPGAGENIIADVFGWGQIDKSHERPRLVADRNLSSLPQTVARGEVFLRKTAVVAITGEVIVPVNCGQRLYDVIEINDIAVGLTNAGRRVLGISLIYRPDKREYIQKITLGGV